MPVINSRLHIENQKGLHARPASQFVTCANQFTSNIHVRGCDLDESEEEILSRPHVVGGSILGLLTLGAEYGTYLHVHIEGDDAEKAMKALAELLASKFGEE